MPIALATAAKLKRPVTEDQVLSCNDVELPAGSLLVKLRRELIEKTRTKAS